MARIAIKPVEPLEIEFIDGEVKVAMFNNEAFLTYADEFGEINNDMKELAIEKPYEFGARLLYCGLKVANPLITFEEASSLMVMGGEPLFSEMLRLMIDNFMVSTNEETKKKFQKNLKKELKEIERFMQKKME